MIIGLQGGARGELDLGKLLPSAPRWRRPRCAAAARGEGGDRGGGARARLAAGGVGRVRPVVDRVLPLTDAAAAHRVVEASEQVGKVILQT